jgi:hypothetical protein
MSASLSSLTCNGWKGLIFKSSFMRSIMVDRGMPSSADLYRVDFTGDCVTVAATAWHVSRLVIGRHLVDGLSHCLLRKRVFPTPILLLFLALQHQSGLEMSLSLSPWCRRSKVFHEARPLSPTSARWYTDSDQQPCLKLNCALQGDCTVTNPNQPKATNTSNLSLDGDPTDGITNSREIQGGGVRPLLGHPDTLDLCTRWRWTVSLTPLSFYLRENAPGIHWMGGWVVPKAGLDTAERREISWLRRRQSRRNSRPSCLYPVAIPIELKR